MASAQVIAQPDFFTVNPIQIQHRYVIENPNPNPIFKIRNFLNTKDSEQYLHTD